MSTELLGIAELGLACSAFHALIGRHRKKKREREKRQEDASRLDARMSISLHIREIWRERGDGKRRFDWEKKDRGIASLFSVWELRWPLLRSPGPAAPKTSHDRGGGGGRVSRAHFTYALALSLTHTLTFFLSSLGRGRARIDNRRRGWMSFEATARIVGERCCACANSPLTGHTQPLAKGGGGGGESARSTSMFVCPSAGLTIF